jgi:hypothetical protein
MSRTAARPHERRAPATARARAQVSPAPRRVSGPSVRAGAVALPAPARRRGTTGAFERVLRLPDHRVVDRLLRSRAWIWLVGILLGGIVAMQVSLLKLNSGISRAVETSATLERQNADLEESIARLSSSERTRNEAEGQGMIMPAAGDVSYLTVRPAGDAARAVARMRPPSDAARQLMANRGVVPGSLAAGAGTTTPGALGAGAAGASGPAGAGTSGSGTADTGAGGATGVGTSGTGTSAGAATGTGTSGAGTSAGGATAGGATGAGTSAGGSSGTGTSGTGTSGTGTSAAGATGTGTSGVGTSGTGTSAGGAIGTPTTAGTAPAGGTAPTAGQG